MNNTKWEEFYLEAIREIDGQSVARRIAKARSAIRERLEDLDGGADHDEERHKIEKVLNNLKVLEILVTRVELK